MSDNTTDLVQWIDFPPLGDERGAWLRWRVIRLSLLKLSASITSSVPEPTYREAFMHIKP